MTARFETALDGIRVEVPSHEAELLRVIPQLLREVDREDPAFELLHPHAYPADPEADREFHRLVSNEADHERRSDQSAFARSLDRAVDGTTLTPEEADSWLRVLAEARLLLAVRLDDEQHAEPDIPLAGFYDYLTWLQGDLVDAVTGRLGP